MEPGSGSGRIAVMRGARWTGWIALAAACLLRAAPAGAQDTLPELRVKANDAFDSASFEEALAAVDALLAREDLTPTDSLQAFELRALSLVALGRETEARDAFCRIFEECLDYIVGPPDSTVARYGFQEKKVLRDAQIACRCVDPPEPPPPPPTMKRLVIAGATTAALATFAFLSDRSADDSWNEYLADPSRPSSLYDDYEGAHRRANYLGIGAAVAAGWVGTEYFLYHRQKKASERIVRGPGSPWSVGLASAAGGSPAPAIALNYRFR
jgi:hypothetical protein